MIVIDAKGDACPLPVIKAKKALDSIERNGTVQISVDNKIAAENLGKMAGELRYSINVQVISSEHYDVTIVKGEGEAVSVRTASSEARAAQGNGGLVVIRSDKMGNGNDELGAVLLKAFIYSLTELDVPPAKIIFYNGGAKIPIEGSNALNDLKKLAESGVEILTCGACLNFYGLTEKLAVGSVTNMFAITQALQAAEKIIQV